MKPPNIGAPREIAVYRNNWSYLPTCPFGAIEYVYTSVFFSRFSLEKVCVYNKRMLVMTKTFHPKFAKNTLA